MAVSIVTYTGDGSTTQYVITFEYISRDNVVVQVNDVDAAFTFINDTTVELTNTPSSGDEITIKRDTPSTPLVDFTDGSTLFEADLDLAHQQSRFLAEEARDIADDARTTVEANLPDVKTVADIESDVSTVAAIDTDVTTVSNVSTNVTTVANNIADVNTVAANISDVVTVAQDLNEAISEIETVANDLNETASDIETVAASIDDVNALGPVATYMPTLASISNNINTVGQNNQRVTTVADNIANVNTVASNTTNINRVSAIQTNVTTVSNNVTDVNTVAARSSDISKLADIQDGTLATGAISTAAGISSDISTVSGVSTAVSTVAGISAAVTNVANNDADVSLVATNMSNVNAVANVSTDVTAVSNITSDVTTVASINPAVTTVAGISSAVSTVAADSTVINTVANAITDVSTVSSDIASVITAANDLNEAVSEIETVAASITDVDTVGTNITNVNKVAAIDTDVTSVATIDTDVTSVANIDTNVTTVAGISSDVSTVAGISADVSTVAADGVDIGSVAANITAVNNVGSNITNVNTVATNIDNINDFSDIYRVGSTDPSTSLDTGDLFYNTSSGTLKVYNGTGWEQGVTAGSGFLPLSGGTLTGSLSLDTGYSLTADDFIGDLTGNANTASALQTGRSISLGGDVSGSATFDGSGDITITATVADDSHNHTISNVDGLQTALDNRLGLTAQAADSALLDGQSPSYYLDWSNVTNKPSPSITLTGDVSGSTTLTQLGNVSFNVQVANDSHTHDTRYYTKSASDSRYVNASGDSMTGALTAPYATFNGTGAVKMPAGTTAQQPSSASLGMFRYNSTDDAFEGYTSEGWGEIGGGAAELIDCGTASSQSGTLFDLGSASSA
jgi:chaperonin cofactor prefoldin